ncbi:MAG: hypothetical protein GY834_10740 [Bacteroidetes bacterium]|nr:hypothetical protein [Bacteroidota bacterium]
MAKAYKCDNCESYFSSDNRIDTFFDVHVNKGHTPWKNFNLTIKVDVRDVNRDICPACLKLFFGQAIKELELIKED